MSIFAYLPKSLATRIASFVFANSIRDRVRVLPPWGDTWETEAVACDGNRVRGWVHRPPGNIRGTLFLTHGFTQHSGKEWYCRWLKRLSDKYELVVCGVDLRHHGHSGNAIPTFGAAEGWDLKAMLDEADKYSSPRPYILFGESLGALAVQRVTIQDVRVHSAICVQPPGWPWDAIGVTLKKAVGLGDLIVKAYGPNYNVLSDGDIRTLSGTPAHRPYLLYVMGDEDHFGLDKTKMVWDHWYADQQAAFNTSPTQAPKQRKWFRVVERACHASGAVDEYTVFEWDGFWPLVDEFIDLTLHSSHSESSSF